MDYQTTALENMIKSQLLPIDVIDPDIIEAFIETPRHLFVPVAKETIAYCDGHILLDECNRPLLSPSLYALMIKAAEIKKTDHVLDIGCLTGYSSAILSKLASKVFAIEPQQELASKAHTILKKLHVENIIILQDELSIGHPENAPYHVILMPYVTDTIPKTISEQLDPNDGRLVALLQDRTGTVHVTLVRKHQSHLHYQTLSEFSDL